MATGAHDATMVRLRGLKKRRALVISAGGIRSGIQVLYVGYEGDEWEIFSTAYLPWPQRVGDLIARLNETEDPVALSDFAWLDYKVTMLFLDAAKAALTAAHKSIGGPHYAALNKPNLWKGPTGENLQQGYWNVMAGDAPYLATSLGIPVITEFLRHNIVAGGPGLLPTYPGSLIIARKTEGVGLFLNIGMVSRMSIIGKGGSKLIFESDVGPGTVLIDKCAAVAECPGGIDRDGQLTAKGYPNAECLEILSADPWLSKAAPKYASPEIFANLLSHPCLNPLSNVDKMATITALTAVSAYHFYRREYRGAAQPEALWVSGGGGNNLALLDYLKASFDPIPVRSVEELGVPADMKIPLTLGLTADAFICGKKVPWESGVTPKIKPLGRWVLP
ncbi:MAG: anhydro-N-acetylmuramic acid kinase [Chitinispirillia bacterium]|nr:anhydro-N-acetylmuramic acid kinase [Chitinispirillia bacterium]MCL2241169.1 anhydro-N-acetylmuramic acid kinase [Chitinispirillia bacterium]